MEYSFGSCTSLKLLDFSSYESVPTLYAANAGMKILVPSELLTDWRATSNWSDFASYIVDSLD